MKLSKHKNFKSEYCATVVQIGEAFPIEGKDKIVQTFVNGLSIVIGKDEFKEGDIAVYCSIETVLNDRFLHLNSMYDNPEMNLDKEAKGYIGKQGRVKVIKLGGVPSYGILLHPASISNFTGESVEDIIGVLKNHIGEDFDEIDGERFVHVYVPTFKSQSQSSGDKKKEKLKRFDMLPEDTMFRFHYDTSQLAKEIKRFKPEDEVYISVKLHGTSAIFSDILTNVPTKWWKRLWRKYVLHTNEYDQKYNFVYSSRNVIKNRYINPKQKEGGYYGDDVWGYWAQKLKGHFPHDYVIYGEIVGFNPKGSPIQPGYDYGCAVGQSKLMIYRVTYQGKELEIPDVIKFGSDLKSILGDDSIMSFPLLYEGTLKDLYPGVDTSDHWHEHVLELLKYEKKSWNMEKNEPLCNNKVPREGFVLRKKNDPIAEAFKLKCFKFLEKERKQLDSGEYVDPEMMETYSEEA